MTKCSYRYQQIFCCCMFQNNLVTFIPKFSDAWYYWMSQNFKYFHQFFLKRRSFWEYCGSWRFIRILFHVCMNLDGTNFHFWLRESQTGMVSKTHVFCHALHVTIWLPGWQIFGEFMVSLGRSMTWQSRKILLFFNHCPAHPEAVGKFKTCKWSLLLQMLYQFCNL